MNSEEKTKGYKVLIVDDDEFLLEMYALKFREEGFEVEIAKSGREAFEKAMSVSVDAMLLDVVLPEIDGFSLLQKIRAEKKSNNALVIMLTNLSQKDDAERGMRLGADDYIIKAHYTPSEVVEKVRKLLAKRT